MTAPTYQQAPMWFTKDTGADPAYPGEQTYNAGNYRSMDVLGVFNPRDVWTNLFEGPTANIDATTFCTIVYVTGTPFTNSITWYRDAAKSLPLVAQVYQYTGTNYVAPTGCIYTLYNAAGAAVHTCSDTYTYTNGVFLTGVTRVLT